MEYQFFFLSVFYSVPESAPQRKITRKLHQFHNSSIVCREKKHAENTENHNQTQKSFIRLLSKLFVLLRGGGGQIPAVPGQQVENIRADEHRKRQNHLRLAGFAPDLLAVRFEC